jgi:hypothetical protein
MRRFINYLWRLVLWDWTKGAGARLTKVTPAPGENRYVRRVIAPLREHEV